MPRQFRSKFSLFGAYFLCCTVVSAQQIPNEIIVQLGKGTKTLDNITATFSRVSSPKYDLECLSQVMNFYLIKSDQDIGIDEIREIRAKDNVVSANYNQKVTERLKPNDPLYQEQWAPEYIEMEKVWGSMANGKALTGGNTYDGTEIVVAVIDKGIDIGHKDLVNNIFINAGEIPHDGIDNDGNGVIDDVHGFNCRFNSNIHQMGSLGTWVSGIIGGEGDNNLGITGVNWKIKILPISGLNGDASIIRAYDYVYSMKKMFNESNGTKGANILVTNFSSGRNEQFPEDNAVNMAWCEFYDLLGQEGILSVGAVANENYNIDEVGDMPGSCTSPYFISVTSGDQFGVKASNRSYGKVSVDLAAPGEEIFGPGLNNGYYFDSGTSASAPYVAGVAALLFSTPCSGLQKLIDEDRVEAVNYIKRAILEGIRPNQNFENITVSGGHLNAYNALLNMQEVCENTLRIIGEKGPINIKYISSSGNLHRIEYVVPDENSYTLRWTDVQGRILKSEKIETQFGQNIYYSKFEPTATGIYFVSMFTKAGDMTSRKVFIPRLF